MATVGFRGDVDNSIPMTNAYPIGRTYGSVPPSGTDLMYRNNVAGELGALNQDYMGANPMQQVTNVTNGAMKKTNGVIGKPANWWFTFFLVFVLFVWVARRYAPEGEQFSNIKLSFWNGLFLTLWIVLILNLLKVVAARIKVPGLSEMILSA